MALVNLDKIRSGAVGNLESVIVYTDETFTTLHEDFANGLLVELGGYVDGKREVRKAYPVKDSAAGKEVLLIATPELDYDERLNKEQFVNKKGQIARAFYLAEGDVFQITVAPYLTNPVKDEVFIGKNGKYVKADAALAVGQIGFLVAEAPSKAISAKEDSVALIVQRG